MAKRTQWKVWAEQRTCRNQNWTENEITALIEVWYKHLDILKFHRRTGKIYKKMAGEFAQYGFKRTSLELQKKVSNLTQEYRKENTKLKNGLGPSNWKFFDSVEEIVTQLNASRAPLSACSNGDAHAKSIKESDTDNNVEDMKFMTVYLSEKSMSEDDEDASNPELQMPVIVSVESQHPDQNALASQKADDKSVLKELKSEMERVFEQSRRPVPTTLVFCPKPQESANEKVLKDLKTDMHRVLQESLGIHRQQVAMQQRQIVLQEDMLKIMGKFIDNCP